LGSIQEEKELKLMHIPLWKKWLSHINPFVIEMTGSEQNPELAVLLNRGRMQLLSGNAIYSWDDLYRNFSTAFDVLKIRDRAVEEVLVLGLGLGSVPFMLEKKFGVNAFYTAVEWDETVAELAARYTFSRMKSGVNIVTADAAVFMEICESTFDLIVVDIFEDDLTPPQFEVSDFLEHCARCMNPGSILLFNRLYGEHKDKVAADRYFERVFKSVFPEAWTIDTQGNLILCAAATLPKN
jgi:SAM-dependent methyltransferase